MPHAAAVVRTVRGALSTLLTICALVSLGLHLLRPAHAPEWADGVGGAAWLLPGWRMASAAMFVGISAWVGGVIVEAAARTRAARIAGAVLILASPWIARAADDAYWAPREYRSVWKADGRPGAEGVWRGVVGGSCGYGSLVEVRVGADGYGRGTAITVDLSAYTASALLAFAPLDGPLADHVEVALHGDEMTIWSETDPPAILQVITP